MAALVVGVCASRVAVYMLAAGWENIAQTPMRFLGGRLKVKPQVYNVLLQSL